jgi:hypothetical protein
MLVFDKIYENQDNISKVDNLVVYFGEMRSTAPIGASLKTLILAKKQKEKF